MDIREISKRNPLLVRLTPEERAKLQAMADAWGVSLAGALRRLLREAKPPKPS